MKLLNCGKLLHSSRKLIHQLPSSLLYISVKEESHTLHIQQILLISFHILCFPFLLSGSCLGLKTTMIFNASPSLRPYNSSANPIDSVIKINPAFNYFCLPPLRPPWFKPPPPCAWTLETVTTLPMSYTQLYDCGHSECFQVNQAGPLCGTPQ